MGSKTSEMSLGQVKIVEEMVSSGVKALVIAPADSKALVPAPQASSSGWDCRDQHR